MPFGAEQRADDGVERRRGVAVHRHEQRRRRGQEGALHHQLRPLRQRRAPAGLPLLGNGQLAVQHRQRVPRALDAERHRPRADRAERRAVGRDAGQRRQDVVPGRRERPAVVLPVPDPLRQLHRRRSVREGLQTFRGARRCASPTCSRACAPCGCRTDRSTRSPARPATTSIAATGCPPISSATTSTASRSAASSAA